MIDFIELLFVGMADCFLLLDSIEVADGVSVLSFLIAIVVISVMMPILLTIGKAMSSKRNVRVDKHD